LRLDSGNLDEAGKRRYNNNNTQLTFQLSRGEADARENMGAKFDDI
jgi:hypothetical protein